MSFKTIIIVSAALAVSPPSLAASPATAADAPAQPAPASVDEDDKIKCRSMAVTGSWAKREKLCLTVAEWKQRGERANEVARDMVDAGRVCSTCTGN